MTLTIAVLLQWIAAVVAIIGAVGGVIALQILDKFDTRKSGEVAPASA